MTTLPKSVAGWSDPIAIAVVVIGLYAACNSLPLSTTDLSLILCGAIIILLFVLEWFRTPWRGKPRPAIALRDVLRRAAVEWLGTMAGIAIVLFAWWLLPEYMLDNFKPLSAVMPYMLPLVIALTTATILYTEWRLGPADDAGWYMGLLILGRWREIDWYILRDGLLGSWLVKGFFLPLNFCWLVTMMEIFRGSEATVLSGSWPHAVNMIDKMILCTLVVGIMPGYLFSSRLFGSHIRKTEHSWFGWMVTMFCYSPLLGGVTRGWISFFHYYQIVGQSVYPWAFKLQDMPVLAAAAGSFIVFFELFHYWSESIFGIRSSNLTNRGIITNGPYRLFKHPVYGVKCIAWFLIWLPILRGDTVLECLRLTLMWAMLCGVYGMRAWVEERMLSNDQTYVDYALWIDRHGWLAWLGKMIPPLSFRWRLDHWQTRGR